MPHYKEGFHVSPDYYKPVPLWVSVVVLPVVWILIPLWSYNPDLFDPFLNDRWQKVMDGQKHHIAMLFKCVLWAHAIQCIIVAKQCRKLGICSRTMLHWMLSVGFHGLISLRHLIWPDKSEATVKVH